MPDDVIEARDKLQARRKLALILRSKVLNEIPLKIGDLVDVFRKKQNEKSGTWSYRRSSSQ